MIYLGQRFRLMSSLAKLVIGEIYEVGNFTDSGNVIMRDARTKLAVTAVNVDEFFVFFSPVEDSGVTDWTPWQAMKDRAGDAFFYRTNGKKVQVKCVGARGEASCNVRHGDKFDLSFGIQLAYYDCVMKAMCKKYDALADSMNDVRRQMIDLVSERNKFVLKRYSDNES